MARKKKSRKRSARSLSNLGRFPNNNSQAAGGVGTMGANVFSQIAGMQQSLMMDKWKLEQAKMGQKARRALEKVNAKMTRSAQDVADSQFEAQKTHKNAVRSAEDRVLQARHDSEDASINARLSAIQKAEPELAEAMKSAFSA